MWQRLEAMESFKNIVAPFDGVVTARKTDIGALINAGNGGQELFEVSDLHKVRIYVQVPQAFSAELRSGAEGDLRDAAISRPCSSRDRGHDVECNGCELAQHAG